MLATLNAQRHHVLPDEAHLFRNVNALQEHKPPGFVALRHALPPLCAHGIDGVIYVLRSYSDQMMRRIPIKITINRTDDFVQLACGMHVPVLETRFCASAHDVLRGIAQILANESVVRHDFEPELRQFELT